MTDHHPHRLSRQQQLFDSPITKLPPHGPGCKPLAGAHNFRDPGQPRYVCAPGCPHRRTLAELEALWLQQQEARHE